MVALLGIVVLVGLGNALPVGPREPGASAGSPSVATLPSASPGASRATPAPEPIATDITVDVPAAIDPTGKEDVTAELQAVIDAALPGTEIRLRQDARYRVDGTLLIDGRERLIIDGQGATVAASARGDDPDRAMWRIRSSRGIALRDLTVIGGHPDPGTYVKGFEWQHGVSVEGGRDVELQGLTIRDVMGDCVYVASDEARWADGVWVSGLTCRDSGRQGIAVVAGRNIRVEGSTFGDIPLSVFDLEPEASDTLPQGVDGAVFTDNVVDGPYGGKLFNAVGVGSIEHVLVERTVVRDSPWGISVQVAPMADSPRYRDLVFRDNQAEGAFVGLPHVVLSFGDVDDLIIAGNSQRIVAAIAAIRLVRTCNVILEGNDLSPIGWVQEERGSCS
jgi:hypothetical protein